MNLPAHMMTTTAAEGLPRRRFTVADVERMCEVGIIGWDERIELIGGEIVPMSPKGNRHEILRIALNCFWMRRISDDVELAPETTFRLSVDTYLEPDFVFYPTAAGVPAECVHCAARGRDRRLESWL